MKKVVFVVASVCLALSYTQAQKKYERIMYTESSVETDEMTVTGKSAVSMAEYTKFNLKIANKSDEFILFKPAESKLIVNGKDYIPKEKPLEVPPTETDNRVVDIKGSEFMVNSYSYEISGLYKLSTTTQSVEAADFQLPPSINEFKVGGFTCNMKDLNKETDKTKVKFECRYTGKKIGVIHPGRAAIKLPDGSEIANAKSSQAPIIIEKGESKEITLYWNRMQGGKATDMQKIKLMIVWRDTFIDADPVKLKPVTLDFKIDEAKSK